MYRQIVQPNVNINEVAGWCLSYARRVFGAPAVESSAWEGWTHAKFKHENRDFPSGMSVPVWFDWTGDVGNGRHRYGHVAVKAADGKIWSSPLSGTGRAWFATVDDLTRAFGGGMRYVGWTEDISTVKVIEQGGEEMEPTSYEVARIYAQKILFRDMDRSEWEKFHHGKSRNQLFDEFTNSDEWTGKWQIINIAYPQTVAQLQLANSNATGLTKAGVVDYINKNLK